MLSGNNPKKIEDIVFRPNWPEGVKPMTQYIFKCDDSGPRELHQLKLTIAEDGDVWVGMHNINLDGTSSVDKTNPFPSVRCRTFAGGGRHCRTRQALLWLAKAIILDNAELGLNAEGE